MVEWLFKLSVILIAYTYLLYPVLLITVSSLHRVARSLSRGHSSDVLRNEKTGDWPAVTVVFSAFNEESCIGERVRNLLALDYPEDLLVVVAGSDGSTDRTAEILRSFNDRRVRPRLFAENRGKISVLNELMAEVETSIVVLTDANTRFAPDAVKHLVAHFVDSKVGVVCGELRLLDSENAENRDGLYWRYEQKLKRNESRLGALLGANGAIYAIRRGLYNPLPRDTIVDDFQIVMNVSRQGYRVLYEPRAKATEEVAPTLENERGRRVRIGAGNYQALLRTGWALNPLLGFRFLAYLSHKVIRWFVPHLMMLAWISNALLLDQPLYLLTFLAQNAAYLMAWLGYRRQKAGKPVGLFISLLTFFVTMNIALFHGFLKFLRSDLQGTWQRTERSL